MARLTDHPNMTIAVYHGFKAIKQQYNNNHKHCLARKISMQFVEKKKKILRNAPKPKLIWHSAHFTSRVSGLRTITRKSCCVVVLRPQ